MSGKRARRVRRNKALKAMYCPNGALHGPHAPLDYFFKRYYRNVMLALAEKINLELGQMMHGTRTVTFPIEIR